jgi:hypothetical protein
MARWSVVVAGVLSAFAACVPADEAELLGSVEFTIGATAATAQGIGALAFADGWEVRFDRVIASFKTMTVGRIGEPEACAYRGRGAVSDVVFDPRYGIVQTFNGIRPTWCRDVGVVLGAPSASTTLAGGATVDDLLELSTGAPAHLLVEGVATRFSGERRRLSLRFDSARAPREFGGCNSPAGRGVEIWAEHRERVRVELALEGLFREGVGSAYLRFAPFLDADAAGDADGVITTQDLARLSLVAARAYSELYQLPDGTIRGSFGDYVRALLRFSVVYDASGQCVGNEP